MNSTVRVYLEKKRIATGKPWKGKFLQVYPEMKTFESEAQWRSHMYQSILSGIRFEVKEKEKEKENRKTEPVAAPVAPPPSPEPAESENWICGYCRLPAGNDHRLCICNGYRYSVAAWEKARIFPSLKKNPPIHTISLSPSLWAYESKFVKTLPAGKYYIGDLCYALHNALYDRIFGPKYNDGYYVMKNSPSHVFMMGGTGGDGEFRGSDGKNYAVDAGIIGIASESTLDPKKKPYDGGRLFTFTSPVKVNLKGSHFSFEGEHSNDPQLTIAIEDDYESYEESE